jgi:hypothetical protein
MSSYRAMHFAVFSILILVFSIGTDAQRRKRRKNTNKNPNENPNCKPGEGYIYSDFRTQDSCGTDSFITNAGECKYAADLFKDLGIGGKKGFGYSFSEGNLQRGCYFFEPDGYFYYNENKDISNSCSKNRQCLCATKKCVKCPAGYYGKGGNMKCKECLAGTYSDKPGQKQCNSFQDQLDKIWDVTKQVKKAFAESQNLANKISDGQSNNLKRQVAIEEVRQRYDKNREEKAESYYKHDVNACTKQDQEVSKEQSGSEDMRRVNVFSAIPLHTEINENTCLSTNRDELIVAFCNFRKRFDNTLSEQKTITKNGKSLWPNICCVSSSTSCKPSDGLKQEDMVPFALSEGGKVTKQSLYGEIVDVLRAVGRHHKQGGYLLRGMLQAIDEIPNNQLETKKQQFKDELKQVFKKIRLCGPRVFNSPGKSAEQLCELFHPYSQLMNFFHEKFKRMLKSNSIDVVNSYNKKSQNEDGTALIQTTSSVSRVESVETPIKNVRKDMCKFEISDKNNAVDMEQKYCSIYQPFDTIDERIINIAMFHISNDIGRDNDYIKALAENARFIAHEKCFHNPSIFTGEDFSFQSIDMGEGKEKEWVLVAKLDSSRNSYLFSQAKNCNGKYVPRLTANFGIYIDKDQCCERSKSLSSCQQCESTEAPVPLDQKYTKERMFYELQITGNIFQYRLDKNPVLPVTKNTFFLGDRTNTVKSEKGRTFIEHIKETLARQKPATKLRRRLLSISEEWIEFAKNVELTKGSCLRSVLEDVLVTDEGEFSYNCAQARALCACIEKVGEDLEEQHFNAFEYQLNVFEQDGYVGYEIFEHGEAIIYGDVNAKTVNTKQKSSFPARGIYRRRRLLQTRGSGS